MIGKHLFDLDIELTAPLFCPDRGSGAMYVGGVAGGRFTGERVSGEIVPVGGDWARVAPCGAARLDVRMLLRSSNDQFIVMHYQGRMHAPPAVMERLGRGEPVQPSDYYMRIAPVFESHAPTLAWLDRILAIGTGRVVGPGRIHYQVTEIV